jgi:hypothetical protein
MEASFLHVRMSLVSVIDTFVAKFAIISFAETLQTLPQLDSFRLVNRVTSYTILETTVNIFAIP